MYLSDPEVLVSNKQLIICVSSLESTTNCQLLVHHHHHNTTQRLWAVCHKFSHWLKGKPFTVWTDNNPLTYILTKPKLDASEQRWVSILPPFDFDIKYVPGFQNVIPDRLSRAPFIKSSITRQIIQEAYQSLVNQVKEVQPDDVQDAFHLTVITLVLSS